MANPAAGVSRSSHAETPAGRMLGTARTWGSTIATMTAAAAAALRRSMAPTARARTAATASSAAVPAITRRSVSADAVAVGAQDPLAKRDGEGGGDQPGDEGNRRDHDGLGRQHLAAARAGGQRGADQAAPVFGGDELGRHHDHRDKPGERADEGALDPGTVHDRRDVARPGDGEPAAGLLNPCRTVVALPIGVSAAPYRVATPHSGSRAAQADVIDDCGGLGEVHLGSAADALGYLHVARRSDEQTGLHGG